MAVPTPPHPESSRSLDGITTPDGRYLVVRGRLWRATNPALTSDARTELTRALMAARRAVGRARRQDDVAAERRARERVHRAKVGLGERGPVWWDDGTPDHNRRLITNTPYADWYERLPRWTAAIARLLDARAPGASICPSEVARHAAPANWRRYLDEIRHVARHLARHRSLTLTQKGRVLDPDEAVRGPIRLTRPRGARGGQRRP